MHLPQLSKVTGGSIAQLTFGRPGLPPMREYEGRDGSVLSHVGAESGIPGSLCSTGTAEGFASGQRAAGPRGPQPGPAKDSVTSRGQDPRPTHFWFFGPAAAVTGIPYKTNYAPL